jgi:hypothetical protein
VAQFQSEIELRVKVIDKELRDLEKRAAKIQSTNPFSASGGRRGASEAQKQTAALKAQKVELELINRATKQQSVEQIKLLNKRTAWLKVLKEGKQISKDIAAATEKEAKAAQKVAAANKKARIEKATGAASGAIVSGAFPLLTGGSGAESILGAAGGAIGGLLGPLGSFAGGIGGSAIGRLITDAEELNKSLAKLNVSLGTVGKASVLTKDNLGKLSEQLGITKEDTIALIEEFNGLAAAGEAAALARQFGNVGGASTAEAIAAAAQDEVSALNAIEQLRGVIGLEAAQQLQDTLEQEGVQTTIAGILDTVLKLNQDISVAQAEQVTFADRLKSVWLGISDIILGLDGFKTPGQIAQDRVDALGNTDTKDRLGDLRSFLEQQRRLREQFKPQRTPRGRAGGALPQSKELQLRQQILKTELAVANIQGKRAALQLTDLEAIRAKEQLLAASLVKETQIIELARQQALINSKVPGDNALINELYDDRLKKIQAQNFLLREQNGLAEKNILLQQDLVALRNEQQTEGIVQGLERGIEDANSRSSSEMLSLRIKQLRRQEDVIGAINDKLAEQRRIEAGFDAEKAAAATREIGFLEDRKAKIEELLPVLNQAEQAQLKYNQAFAAVTPAVNSLVSGLGEVVAGTKTAEEAFADFLKTIGEQLINTAATMIAQYIALGIARMFAFGGAPATPSLSASGGGDPLGALTGNIPFTLPPGRAEGGPVSANTPYIVGENGPELFVPFQQGNITSNKDLEEQLSSFQRGGNSNVSNSFQQLQTMSLPFTRNAEQASMAAAERETAQAISNPAPLDVRFESQVINGVEYVTAEQHRQGMEQAAERGRAMTLTTLQNSPRTRRKVGI